MAMLPGFQKASSFLLPKVDAVMVADYFSNENKYVSTEIRGVKAERSTRESYGDSAIGYVQVKRECDKCTVITKVTPEHKVKSKAYDVTVRVDEKNEKILEASCNNCAASSGGCKHSIAVIAWLHRRSEDPSPTSADCYWKKSKLSSVGTVMKYVTSDVFSHPSTSSTRSSSSSSHAEHQNTATLLDDIVSHKSLHNLNLNCQVLKHLEEEPWYEVCRIDILLDKFISAGGEILSSENFMTFCKDIIPKETPLIICEQTTGQAKNKLWYDIRYARITASKVYEAAHCYTPGGTLVESILGATKLKDNKAMKRGRELEPVIRNTVSKKLGKVFIDCGIYLCVDSPIFGASPDGVTDAACIEIKCPTSEKAFHRYITKDNHIAAKYKAQVHMQMLLSNRPMAYFCVADWNYETSRQVTIIEEKLDEEYIKGVLHLALAFWKQHVFPQLLTARAIGH